MIVLPFAARQALKLLPGQARLLRLSRIVWSVMLLTRAQKMHLAASSLAAAQTPSPETQLHSPLSVPRTTTLIPLGISGTTVRLCVPASGALVAWRALPDSSCGRCLGAKGCLAIGQRYAPDFHNIIGHIHALVSCVVMHWSIVTESCARLA